MRSSANSNGCVTTVIKNPENKITDLDRLRRAYRSRRPALTDSTTVLDPSMWMALQRCIPTETRFLAVTLGLPKGFSSTQKRRQLETALKAHTERLSRKYGRKPRDNWLRAVYVLESPERLRHESRQRSGPLHHHVQGFLEVPDNVPLDEFKCAAAQLWTQSAFFAPCGNEFKEAPDPKGWSAYIGKQGSHDPKTNGRRYNELLFENLRPIMAAGSRVSAASAGLQDKLRLSCLSKSA